MKSNLRFIIISLILVPLWGLGSLSAMHANKFATFSLFFVSLTIRYFIKGRYKKTANKYLLFIGPVFYLVVILIAQPLKTIVYNPILWLFLSIVVIVYVRKINLIISILYISTAIIYSFIIYPKQKYGIQPYNSINQNEELVELSLSTFDTIWEQQINKKFKKGDLILLETWNEKCLPCLKSINLLQDTLAKIKHLNHFLLYQEMGSKNLNTNQITSFKSIKNKANILIDKNNQLFSKMNFESYPYFILYNSDGNYISHRKGFSPLSKNEILNYLHQELNSSRIKRK